VRFWSWGGHCRGINSLVWQKGAKEWLREVATQLGFKWPLSEKEQHGTARKGGDLAWED